MNSTTDPSFADFNARMRDEPVYVILGVQGSGTNLLRSILDPAFNFSVVQDQALVFNAAARLGASPTHDAVRREFEAMKPRLVPTALSRKTLRRIKTNGSFEGIDGEFGAADIRTGTDLAYFIYAYSAFSRKSPVMAIKSDDLWESIGHIDEVLPNRRIILLTRDFRDNFLSIAKKNFGPVEPLIAAQYVKHRFAYYDAEFRRAPIEHRIHVRYEDLLEAPDAFVARLGEHFGLVTRGGVPPPVETGRIRKNNTRKWASLSTRELGYCEAILRDELHTYGYGCECQPVDLPSAATVVLARGRDAIRRIPQKLGTLGRRLTR